jgi:hypothetical protein
MSKETEASRPIATPRQWTVVAVLAVILVVVLLVQFTGIFGSETAEPKETGKRSRQPPELEHGASEAPSTSRSTDESRPPKPWPRFSPDEALRFDPFAPSTQVAEREGIEEATSKGSQEQSEDPRHEQLLRLRAAQAEALQELRAEGVKAVVGSHRGGHAAVIGSQVVRVGDMLNGFRVVQVDSDGVIVEQPPAEKLLGTSETDGRP